MRIVENNLKVIVLNDLRESVGWMKIDNNQLQKSLDNSLYSLEIIEDELTVATGRIIGDGVFYHSIVDVIVRPDYQSRGYGRIIVSKLIEYIENSMDVNSFKKSTINIVAAEGKEGFYLKLGFKDIKNEGTGTGMQLRLIK